MATAGSLLAQQFTAAQAAQKSDAVGTNELEDGKFTAAQAAQKLVVIIWVILDPFTAAQAAQKWS